MKSSVCLKKVELVDHIFYVIPVLFLVCHALTHMLKSPSVMVEFFFPLILSSLGIEAMSFDS